MWFMLSIFEGVTVLPCHVSTKFARSTTNYIHEGDGGTNNAGCASIKCSSATLGRESQRFKWCVIKNAV